MKKQCTNSRCRRMFNTDGLLEKRCPHCGTKYSRLVSDSTVSPIPVSNCQKPAVGPIKPIHSRFAIPENLQNLSIDALDLSVRSYNCMKRASAWTVGDIIVKSPEEMMSIRHMGKKCMHEIDEELRRLGIVWDRVDGRFIYISALARRSV